jgi:hypothetical protein
MNYTVKTMDDRRRWAFVQSVLIHHCKVYRAIKKLSGEKDEREENYN